MLVKMFFRVVLKMCNVLNVLVDFFNVGYGGFGVFEDVVGMFFLVGSNEVGVVDVRKGDYGGYFFGN